MMEGNNGMQLHMILAVISTELLQSVLCKLDVFEF